MTFLTDIQTNIAPPYASHCRRSYLDPFAWVDAHGMWHIVTHQSTRHAPNQFLSGDGGRHIYSSDGGQTWTPSNAPAFGSHAILQDGRQCGFGASQRPFLLFDATGSPTHLYTSGQTTNCTKLPSGRTTDGRCVNCSGGRFPFGDDWTFTTVRPLRAAS